MSRPMKDSYVEWIGFIPTNWNVQRLKFLSSIKTGNKDTIDKVDEAEFPFFVRSPKVERIDSYSFDGEAILTAGDGVGAGKVFHYANGKFNYHQRVYNIHNFKNINGVFLYYYMKVNFIKEVEKGTAKSTVDSIRLHMLQNFSVCLPPIEEQQRIVSFLDEKVTHIDSILADTKESIEALKSYKQSLITETVTKGLDANVEMKDSGIEWIGLIPTHWNSALLSQYFKQVKNKNKELIETNLLSLSYGKIIQKDINTTDGLLPSNFEGYNIIQDNDIVLRMTDLQNDKTSLRVGYSNQDGIITSAYITVRPYNTIHSHYVYFFLHSFDIYKGFYGMGSGVRQNVTFEILKKLEILLPPLNEQKMIVEYIENKILVIDELINDKESLIKEIESYKKSFIYEYVTGKKEVK